MISGTREHTIVFIEWDYDDNETLDMIRFFMTLRITEQCREYHCELEEIKLFLEHINQTFDTKANNIKFDFYVDSLAEGFFKAFFKDVEGSEENGK